MMRSITVVLDALDTSKSIYALAQLAGALPAPITDTRGLNLMKNVTALKIYPESGNNVDAANGCARVAFQNAASRVAATAHGLPLNPGIEENFPCAGAERIYSLEQTFISGAVGDVFQIVYGG